MTQQVTIMQRGLIRPQIGPLYFFRRIALKTIHIDRFHQDKHFGAIFIYFNNIFRYAFNPSLYSIFCLFHHICHSDHRSIHACINDLCQLKLHQTVENLRHFQDILIL